MLPFSWFYLLLLVPAAPLAYDDFRLRRVAVVWLAVLGAGSFGVSWRMQGFDAALLCTVLNAVLLSVLCAALAGWHLLRGKSFGTFFRRSFGAGDVAMMFSATPLFSLAGYVRFLLAGCVAALAWWCVKRPATLPFAGILALVLAAFVLCKTFGLWN